MKTPRINIQYRTIFTGIRLQIKPSELYDQRVSNGELINDDHQRKIVKQLDGVHESLTNYSPPSPNIILKLLSGLKTPPNGLYMHGSVGCGKTMLMDLFFSCCEVSIFLTTYVLKITKKKNLCIKQLCIVIYHN